MSLEQVWQQTWTMDRYRGCFVRIKTTDYDHSSLDPISTGGGGIHPLEVFPSPSP